MFATDMLSPSSNSSRHDVCPMDAIDPKKRKSFGFFFDFPNFVAEVFREVPTGIEGKRKAIFLGHKEFGGHYYGRPY